MKLDVVLRNGRVIDPARSIDAVLDVGFANGKVAALGSGLAGTVERDVTDCIVMPGQIDFHAHVYWGGTSISIDGDRLAPLSGTTTWVDVGSAGPGNFPGFRKHVIESSRSRILAFLHVSHAGIFGFSPTVMVGESEDLRLMDPKTCVQVARENSDIIRGIKVRIGARTSGVNGITPLHYAIEVADHCGLPVMCHIDDPPPRYEDVLAALRPGDILTHCFRPFPNAPCDAAGRIKDACWQARERGVIFDIAHGKAAFDFKVAEAMLMGGFPPDVISSDVHVLSLQGPAYDNLTTMSKFLGLGMPLQDIIRAVTATPARLLRRPDLADLSEGSTGDASVMRIAKGEFAFKDSLGQTRIYAERFAPVCTVVDGKLWESESAD
jgi:dihydroorotase